MRALVWGGLGRALLWLHRLAVLVEAAARPHVRWPPPPSTARRFNSDWCLEVLGRTFVETHTVLEAAYTRFYAEGQQAHCTTKQAAEAARAALEQAERTLSTNPLGRQGSLKAPAILQGQAGPPLSVLQVRVEEPA